MPESTVQIGLRVPTELYERIKSAAHKDERTINGYMVKLLKQYIPAKVRANGKRS